MGNCVTTKRYARGGIIFFVTGLLMFLWPWISSYIFQIQTSPNYTAFLIHIMVIGCTLAGISILMAAYRCFHNCCNNASTESVPLLYTATPTTVPPTKPSTPYS